MKKFILIVSVLTTSVIMNAQVNSLPIIGNKFTFGIDGGLALPGSDYSATGSLNSSSGSTIDGFAKMGYCYNAYAGFKFSKLIGAMVLYGANSNSFNTSDLSSGSSASGGYTVSEYLIGPYMSITLVKIKIEVKLLGGMVSSNYPTISQNSTFNGITSSVVNSFSTGNAFGYCAGAKIKYMMIGGMLGIGVGLNYIGSDVSFKGTYTSETSSVNIGSNMFGTTSSSVNNKMSISILQPTIGLSLDI